MRLYASKANVSRAARRRARLNRPPTTLSLRSAGEGTGVIGQTRVSQGSRKVSPRPVSRWGRLAAAFR